MPQPYHPGTNQAYPEDQEWEAAYILYDNKRPGTGDLKWAAITRDNFRCRNRGVQVSTKTSHADHTIPVKCFASVAQANELDNIQTLCLKCHKLKTTSEK